MPPFRSYGFSRIQQFVNNWLERIVDDHDFLIQKHLKVRNGRFTNEVRFVVVHPKTYESQLPSVRIGLSALAHSSPFQHMNDERESLGTEEVAEQHAASQATAKPSYDEIALRAYFIALNRHAAGEPDDPIRDWVEAERQLFHVGAPSN